MKKTDDFAEKNAKGRVGYRICLLIDEEKGRRKRGKRGTPLHPKTAEKNLTKMVTLQSKKRSERIFWQ